MVPVVWDKRLNILETSKERILKAVDHIQPEVVPINIEGIYADLQLWYDHFDIGMDVWAPFACRDGE